MVFFLLKCLGRYILILFVIFHIFRSDIEYMNTKSVLQGHLFDNNLALLEKVVHVVVIFIALSLSFFLKITHLFEVVFFNNFKDLPI